MPPASDPDPPKGPSIKGTLSLAVILLGALAVVLSLATGEVYRRLSLENQREYLASLLALESRPALDELSKRMAEMGRALQTERGFAPAFAAADRAALRAVLDEQFHQYYVTAGLVPALGLGLARPDLAPLAVAGEGALDPFALCPQGREAWRGRDKVARLRTQARLCFHQGRPVWLEVQAVGGLRPRGYVLLAADPVPALMGLGEALALPVRVRVGERVWAQAPDWPRDGAARWLLARHSLAGEGGELIVEAAKDVRPLLARLAWVQLALVGGASLLALLAAASLWRRIRRIALDPLQDLGAGLARLSHLDAQAGYQPLPERGGREVRRLTRAFNATGEELHHLYRTLEQMAYTDALTRLPNRTRFNEMLELHTRLNRHRAAPFALLVMDLDRFKWVNDTLGHLAGDQLLAQVGERLASVLRKTDVVSRLAHTDDPLARLGGDEFAALVPGVRNETEAAVVAGKLARAMERPFTLEGRAVEVGISIGIALCPRHGREPHQLLRLADLAMYQAKQAGVGYQVYDEARDHSRLYRDTLEGALREAVAGGRGLSLVYQPQVNLESQRVVGVEALLRWRGPEGKPVGPDQFIPIAEQCGLMPRLTRWVLEAALDQALAWREAGLDLRVAVNLSAHNLAEPEFAAAVERALARRGLSAACLCLEITETQLVADPDQALSQLGRLGAMGVRLSLDDFGTGYSSLAYLQRLPLDEIKIDRRFVQNLTCCPEDRVIVEAVVGLARGLGKEVLAEGVEDLAVQTALQRLGCRLVQGYFVARPMPPEDLPAWLERWAARSSGRASS